MNKYNILCLAALSIALMAPATSTAYSLGEIHVQSYLGQPFRATIPIQGSKGKEIDADCLTLLPPPADKDMIYLRRATLSVASQGTSAQVVISGHFPLDEPYLNVVIDLGCKEQGHLVREYTVLIDPPGYIAQPAVTSLLGEDDQSTAKVKSSIKSEIADTGPARTIKKKPRLTKGTKPVQTAKKHRGQLKVLSGSGEKPVQQGMTEKERLQQHEKELMKELDDKTAKYLDMQAQLVKLESKLAEMQKTLEQQNRLLASIQQAPAPANKPASSWNNDYLLAGSFLLVASLSYFLVRRSRKKSLDEWEPAKRDLNMGQGKNPFTL